MFETFKHYKKEKSERSAFYKAVADFSKTFQFTFPVENKKSKSKIKKEKLKLAMQIADLLLTDQITLDENTSEVKLSITILKRRI